MDSRWPSSLEVLVEVPKGARIRRDDAGRVELISPLRCPFNYGSVPGTCAPDGEREDVVLLGPPLPRGARVVAPLHAQVRFVDAGVPDAKWVCGDAPLTPADVSRIERFFRFYAAVKRVARLARATVGSVGSGGAGARSGPTRFEGLVYR
ncbi:MAG: hypothetical protein KC543_01255 [Myxococcales bacterium]|nr:hypothetical protein [Myxococcales bacterium]